MDRIEIRDLRVPTRIGVTREERAEPQPVAVSIVIATDLRVPGRTDALQDTVDYGEVASQVSDLMSSGECALLEHLAEKIASSIARFDRVERVSVEVVKESPPVPEDVKEVAVRIERSFR